MSEIGVVVAKTVRIDRDGAQSLLRTFADWCNNEVLPKRLVVGIGQNDVEVFLKRYADLEPEQSDG